MRPCYNLRTVAVLLTAAVSLAAQTASSCSGNPPLAESASDWNGWGAGGSNARSQTAQGASITAAQVPSLKLKWAFGLVDAKQVFGEPVVVGGRVFFSADTGMVYSVDAQTGCLYWTFQAGAGVRSALVIGPAKPNRVAYFGDRKANVYALDAQKGTLLWKVQVDDHPAAIITGGIQLFAD